MTQFSGADLIAALSSSTDHIVEKPWGRERHITHSEFILKYIQVYDGRRTSLQCHEVKKEIIMIVGGMGGVEVHNGDGTVTMHRTGQRVHILPGTIHRSIGPVMLVEVTTHPDSDCVRLADDYGRAVA